MSQPDAAPVSQPPDYAVLGLSAAGEVEAHWVTSEVTHVLAHLLGCERAGLHGLVLELGEDGSTLLETREVTTRALATSPGREGRQATGVRDPLTVAGSWLAGVLSAAVGSAPGTGVSSWDAAAAKWAAYFRHLPPSEVITRAGLVDQAGWERFRATAAELSELLRHMNSVDSDSSMPAAVRPFSYYLMGFRRLHAASNAVPELRQAAESFLLETIRSSREAAEVAGFVGASSEDMHAWAQDRFDGDPEAAAAAQTRAVQWRARRQLNSADQHTASMWQEQHPSARGDRRLWDTRSAQHGLRAGPATRPRGERSGRARVYRSRLGTPFGPTSLTTRQSRQRPIRCVAALAATGGSSTTRRQSDWPSRPTCPWIMQPPISIRP